MFHFDSIFVAAVELVSINDLVKEFCDPKHADRSSQHPCSVHRISWKWRKKIATCIEGGEAV